MPEDSAEKLAEIQKLEGKIEKIDQLIMDSYANVLKAETGDSVKKAIYEVFFYRLAMSNVEPGYFRLKEYDQEEVEEMTDWLVADKQSLDDISNGHWMEAKYRVEDIIPHTDILAEADEYGLDPNFKYEGVNIFLNEIGNPPENVNKAQRDFIEQKLSLVQDETEPYEYPNLEELKAKVAAI